MDDVILAILTALASPLVLPILIKRREKEEKDGKG